MEKPWVIECFRNVFSPSSRCFRNSRHCLHYFKKAPCDVSRECLPSESRHKYLRGYRRCSCTYPVCVNQDSRNVGQYRSDDGDNVVWMIKSSEIGEIRGVMVTFVYIRGHRYILGKCQRLDCESSSKQANEEILCCTSARFLKTCRRTMTYSNVSSHFALLSKIGIVNFLTQYCGEI